MIKSMPLDTVQLDILQDAASRIWMAAPWRWTIGTIGPLSMVTGQAFITIAYPPDFMRFEQVMIEGSQTKSPLTIVAANVPTPGLSQLTRTVAAMPTSAPTTAAFEVNFNQSSTEAYKFRALYKKNVTIFDTATIFTGNLGMDDEYFWVYEEMVYYYALKYADDQRAGGASAAIGPDGRAQIQYSGQLGVAMAAIETMRLSEPMPLVFPDMQPDVRLDR